MQQLLNDAAFLVTPSAFVKKIIEREFSNLNIQVINHGVSREFIIESSSEIYGNNTENGSR
jgi:hypothetical protein